jgi:hypothetical protein
MNDMRSEEVEMKGRLAAFVGVSCIALLIVSGAYAGKPTDKPGKPPKPGNVTTECFVFTGDLEGGQEVEGCCPNAGPSPAYTMTLDVVGVEYGTYEGYLFAKPVRTKFKGQTTERYKVQFYTWDSETEIPEIPGEGDYFFEIFCDGDDIQYDETTDVLTVTFDNDHENDTATVWVLHDVSESCDASIYPYCDDPCVDMEPACVASDDRHNNCYHPCNEEITIEDVSFIMTRTSDLSYCP